MRTIKEVIDRKTENIINAAQFFSQDESVIFKQRYKLEEAYQLGKKLWVCLYCRQPVLVRGEKDGLKSVYFTHVADQLDCPIKTGKHYTKEEILRMKYNGQKESDRHYNLKHLIAEKISKDSRFSEVKIDKRFDGVCKDWREPDVSAIFEGKRVVFELQLSTTFLSVIAERNLFYRNNQTYIIWIFDNKRQNIEAMRFTEKDVFYPNHHNAFFIDESSDGKQFKLICGFEKPFIDKGLIKNDWQLEKIDFNDLTFGPNFQVYWFDYEYHEKLLIEEIEKKRFLEFGDRWRNATYEDRQHLLSQHNHILKEQCKNFNYYELASLLDCLYSIKFKQVIGYNYIRVVQLIHQYLDKDAGGKSHFGEYVFKAIRVYARDQIKQEDKSEKLFNKGKAYRKKHFEQTCKYDPFLKHLFPELF